MASTYYGVYKRFNGTDWDIVYFKTYSSAVQESENKKFVTDAEKTNLGLYLVPADFNKANKLLQLDANAKVPAAQLSFDIANYLPRAGGTMTGELKMGAQDIEFGTGGSVPMYIISHGGNEIDITENPGDGSKGYSFHYLQGLDVKNKPIKGLADPVSGTDAVTKQWVEQLVSQGTHVVGAVRAASTGNISPLSGTKTIDGVSLVAGDRVLLKNQTTSSQNGVYIVDSSTWSKVANDSDKGSLVFVLEGTTNKGTQYYNSNGTTWNVFFVQDTYNATLNGGLELDGTGFGFKIKAGGITNAMINASAAIDVSKLAGYAYVGNYTAWSEMQSLGSNNPEGWDVTIIDAIRLLRGTASAFTNDPETIKGAYTLANTKTKTYMGQTAPANDATTYNTGDIYIHRD